MKHIWTETVKQVINTFKVMDKNNVKHTRNIVSGYDHAS